MSIFFTILSAAYIAGIFLWADSPIVEELSAFNPYSLLHIPLYGILTILLIVSKLPFNVSNQTNQKNQINQVKVEDKVKVEVQRNQTNQINQTDQRNSINPSNLPREMRSLFHWGPTNPINCIIPGLIAFIVAIADEIHQAYIPGRNASITDVLLDVVGIVLAVIVIHQIRRKKIIGLLGK
jgi:hypothetical protein